MADSYYELQIRINPEIEDIMSNFFFENFPCEGVILAEETYKDLEMILTTEGTLKVFLSSEPADLNEIIKNQRELLKSRGFSDNDLGSWEYIISNKSNEDWSKKWKEKWDITRVTDRIVIVPDWLEYPKGIDPKASNPFESNVIDNTDIIPYITDLLGADRDEYTKELFVDVTDM